MRYPPTLVMTADTDDRVAPGMAKKFAARLQAAGGGGPILIRVETKAGHGAGKPIAQGDRGGSRHAGLSRHQRPGRLATTEPGSKMPRCLGSSPSTSARLRSGRRSTGRACARCAQGRRSAIAGGYGQRRQRRGCAGVRIERAVAQAIDGALDGGHGARRRRGDRRRSGTASSAWTRTGGPVTAVMPWSDTRSARQVDRAARAARRSGHPRAHGMPHPSDLLAGPAAVVRRPRPQDVPPCPPLDVVSGLPRVALARARRGESCRRRQAPGCILHDRNGWDAELCAASVSSREQLGAIVDLDDRTADPAAAIARRWPQLRGRALDSGRGRRRARQRRAPAARPADGPH